MRNIIYRLNGSDNFTMEYWCCNEDIKDDSEVAITIYNKTDDKQIDFDMPLKEIDSLISYLEGCREYLIEEQDKL